MLALFSLGSTKLGRIMRLAVIGAVALGKRFWCGEKVLFARFQIDDTWGVDE